MNLATKPDCLALTVDVLETSLRLRTISLPSSMHLPLLDDGNINRRWASSIGHPE